MTELPFAWGAELPRLSGRRIDLRWITPGDAPALFAVFGDPEVTRFWSSPPLADLAAAGELVREIHDLFAARRLFQWGISSRGDEELIGTCTLASVETVHRRAEIGFALRRDLWGRGLSTEALHLLMDFAFGSLRLHRLEADVDPENTRSIHLLERLGFRREGHLRERWHHLGRMRDTVFLGLLRREWKGSSG